MKTQEKAKQLYKDFGEWIIDEENCTEEMNKSFVKKVINLHILEKIQDIETNLEYYNDLITEVDKL
jgi:hypothetical protein